MRTLSIALVAASLFTAAVAADVSTAVAQTPQLSAPEQIHHHYHYHRFGHHWWGYHGNQGDFEAEQLNLQELQRLGVLH